MAAGGGRWRQVAAMPSSSAARWAPSVPPANIHRSQFHRARSGRRSPPGTARHRRPHDAPSPVLERLQRVLAEHPQSPRRARRRLKCASSHSAWRQDRTSQAHCRIGHGNGHLPAGETQKPPHAFAYGGFMVPSTEGRTTADNAGDNLLSHTVARAVPLAQEGLTSEFGMGSGRTPPLSSPAKRKAISRSEWPLLEAT